MVNFSRELRVIMTGVGRTGVLAFEHVGGRSISCIKGHGVGTAGVLAFEHVGGRSRETELPCYVLRSREHFVKKQISVKIFHSDV